jgi:hypothetical protein
MARHLTHYIGPFAISFFPHSCHHIFLFRVDEHVRTHLSGEVQAELIDVGCYNLRGSGRLSHARCETPDRTTAGNKYGVTGDVGREYGVKRIPNRVHDRADSRWNITEWHHVERGHREILCERTIAIYPDDDGGCADVPVPGSTAPAMPAHDVTFSGDELSHLKLVADVCAQLYDFSGELMTHHNRWSDSALRPLIPFVNMNVGTAHSRMMNTNENIVWAACWFRYIGYRQSWCRTRFDYCSHRIPSFRRSSTEYS